MYVRVYICIYLYTYLAVKEWIFFCRDDRTVVHI